MIFQDEMEIHRHPALTRMWAPVAQQPEVPAPGKNEKRVVYGGVNYKTGKFTYTLSASKCGAAFLAFLMVLIKTYVGQKIILVCDNGRFHTTKAVQAWLEKNKERVEKGDFQEEAAKPGETFVKTGPEVGRNDPCHCGSGKKFKKCHGG